MSACYFIGLDIHKKMIAYCIKTIEGRLVDQGVVSADRVSLSVSWFNGNRTFELFMINQS